MTDVNKNEIKDKLAQTRTALLAFLSGLAAEEWETAVQSEGAHWTIADITRHLLNAEKGMTGLIEQFKVGQDPVPPDFDRERYNRRVVEKTQSLTPAELLAQLEANHTHLQAVIDTLEPDDWQKHGRHASLRIMTITEVCHTIADHEQTHLQEMQAALAGPHDHS